jgi:hypothetical protein
VAARLADRLHARDAGLGLYQLEHGDEYSDNARLGINIAGVFATVLVTDLLFVKRVP